MMAHYAGAGDFKDTTYECIAKADGGGVDVSSWFGPNGDDGPKATLAKKNPLINLPYVVDADADLIVTQSNACYQYLGRKLALYGTTDKDAAECDQLLCQIMDMRNAAVAWFYGSGSREAYEANADDKLAGALGHYRKLEAWLAARGNDAVGGGEGEEKRATFFVLEGAPAVPDFHIWEMIDQHEAVVKDLGRASLLTDAFPRLSQFYRAFRQLPALEGYFNTPAAKFPINNPQAAFV